MLINHADRLAAVVLDLLTDGPMSFDDIRAAAGVSTPTLRRALHALAQAAWILPVGRSTSTGGRPATLYGLAGSTRLLLGVHLELPGLHFVLMDLTGAVVDRVYRHGSTSTQPDDVIREIVRYTHDARLRFGERTLLGIGIATPGYVDPASGTILSIGRVPLWQTFPLKARLEADLGLPVTVDNDVDCMTQVELASSRPPAAQDMIYVGLIEGVKASLVLGGQLYRGPFGNAGLIGHIVVSADGPLCTCGKRGCLEAIASVQAVCEAFDRRSGHISQQSPSLRLIRTIDDRAAKCVAVLNAAEGGEPLCTEIAEEMIRALALAISNVICLLQVPVVVFGGVLSSMPPGLRARQEQRIRELLPPLLNNHLVIRAATVTDAHSAAMGAAHQLWRQYLTQVAFSTG